MKFKKYYILRIIGMLTAGMFIIDTASYGYALSSRSSLRVPSMTASEAGKNRLKGYIVTIKDYWLPRSRIENAGSKLSDSKQVVDQVVLLTDYDNTIAPGDTSIDNTPESLKWFIENLRAGNVIVVHTGRDKARIIKNLVEPLKKALSKNEKRLLFNLVVVHDNGSGFFGFDEKGEQAIYQETSFLPEEDISKIAESLMGLFFSELDGMHLERGLNDKINECKSYAREELSKVIIDESWQYAGQNGRNAAQFHLIPLNLRDKFGDIFIWNKGGMVTLEFDYVNPSLGIDKRTKNISNKVKEKIGESSSDGHKLYFNSHSTAVDISLSEKGPSVKKVFNDIIAKRTSKNLVVVSMGDTKGDFSVFRLDFGNIKHIKVFLGKDQEDIEEAAVLYKNMFISIDKLSEGGQKILKIFAEAKGKTISKLVNDLKPVAILQQQAVEDLLYSIIFSADML
jgi:hypothetical protein